MLLLLFIVSFVMAVALHRYCDQNVKKPKMDTDPFGNRVIVCSDNAAEVRASLQGRDALKADILVGCSADMSQQLGAIFAGHRESDNQPVWVLRNKATSPLVREGKVSAAGVSVLFTHNNRLYTLLHKDKTRSLLMALGGTSEISDGEDMRQTARREVREETSGTVFVCGREVTTSGLKLDKLETVATVKMSSKYYGVQCDDTYTRFGAFVDDDDLLSLLLHDDNKQEDGSFTLHYKNHPETEFLLALPLIWPLNVPIRDALNDLLAKKHRKNVSTLSLLLDQAFVSRPWAGSTWQDAHPALPPSLRSISFASKILELKQDVPIESRRLDPPHYDARKAEDFLDFVHEDAQRDSLQQHLLDIDKKNQELARLCDKQHPENFFSAMQGCLQEIRGSVEEAVRIVGPSFAHRLRTSLLPAFEDFQEMLNEKLEMTDAERDLLEGQTVALWQGQAREHEHVMAAMSTRDRPRPRRCYFSYAWPTSKYSVLEQWVQPFLERLHEELTAAGIRCIMDTKDCGPGENLQTFMRDGIDSSDIVLLFGTRSLLAKHFDTKPNNIQTELVMISEKGKGVVPIVLSGTARSSLPALVHKFPMFDARTHASYTAFVNALRLRIE